MSRSGWWWTWGATLVWAVCVMGCDRNIAPFDPDEQPHPPDLSRIFPAPEETPDSGGAPPMGGAGGGAGPGADAEPAAPVAAGRPGAAVRGTVHVAGDGAQAGVLFVIARPAGAVGGPPLAVQRHVDPEFPFDFEIGPSDVMIPTMRFEGPIALSARLDADGNASTQGEDDRTTASPVAVVPGDVGVELLLQ